MTWYDRDIRTGADSIMLLPEITRGMGATRVLLVTGRASFESSGADRVVEPLRRVATVERWNAFSPNPDSWEVFDGLQVLETFQPNLIVGVGGGSPMDVAKLLMGFRGLKTLEQLDVGIRAGRPTAVRDTPLVLVPTTSGSGSEATRGAVVYIGSDKFSVSDQALLPVTALLDHRLTLSGSPHQRATSGIDAVAQAMESMWAVGATPASRQFARRALAIMLEHLPPFVRLGTEESARAVAFGAHLAGRAIDLTRTTAAHAMAYGLTKQHDIPHGHAVALTLTAFLEIHGNATPEMLQSDVDPEDHARTMTEILGLLRAASPAAGREALRGFMADIGLEPSLDLAAGTSVDIESLAAVVNTERLGNNPVVLDHEALVGVLAAVR